MNEEINSENNINDNIKWKYWNNGIFKKWMKKN